MAKGERTRGHNNENTEREWIRGDEKEGVCRSSSLALIQRESQVDRKRENSH